MILSRNKFNLWGLSCLFLRVTYNCKHFVYSSLTICNGLNVTYNKVFISISCPLVPLCAQHNYSPAAAQDLRGSWSAAQKPEPNARARCPIAEAGHEPTLGPLLLLPQSPTQFRFVLCRRRRRLSHLPQFSRFVCGFARTTSTTTTTTTSASTLPFLVLFLIHYQFFNGRCFCCCFSVSVCASVLFIYFLWFKKQQQQAFSTFTVIPNNVLPCR